MPAARNSQHQPGRLLGEQGNGFNRDINNLRVDADSGARGDASSELRMDRLRVFGPVRVVGPIRGGGTAVAESNDGARGEPRGTSPMNYHPRDNPPLDARKTW